MAYQFGVERWSAFASGLDTPASWQEWARAPWLPSGDAVAALAAMAPMQRRRVERLGRAALQVAWDCQPDAADAAPLVFASRHGDLARTHAMLEDLAREQPLSPTHFGLSTHNAIAAQYSIARGIVANVSVVAAGARSAEALLTEAIGLLADGAPAVLSVMYDEPPPAAYAAFLDEPQASYAWAWRVVPARDGLPRLSLHADDAPPAATGPALPGGLDVLRFLLAGDAALDTAGAGIGWHWRRHG